MNSRLNKMLSAIAITVLMISTFSVLTSVFAAYPAISMWLEPPAVDLNTADHSLGYTFWVTAWLNATGADVGAWQFKMLYNKAYLKIVNIALTGTGGVMSMFFENSGTSKTFVPSPDFGSYDATRNYTLVGESWLEGPYGTGVGSLAEVQFEVTAVPPKGGELTDLIDISTCFIPAPNKLDTYALNPSMVNVVEHAYDCSYTFTWITPPKPRMAVIPPKWEGGFYDNVTGWLVDVGVYIDGLDAAWYLVNASFKFNYDPALLAVNKTTIDTTSWDVAGTATVTDGTIDFFVETSKTLSGTVKVADVSFEIIYQGEYPEVNVSSLTFPYVELWNHEMQIPTLDPIEGEIKIRGFVALPMPHLEVVPKDTVLGPEPSLGEEFTVDVVMKNLFEGWNLVGYDFRLGYDDSLIEVLEVTKGSFLEETTRHGKIVLKDMTISAAEPPLYMSMVHVLLKVVTEHIGAFEFTIDAPEDILVIIDGALTNKFVVNSLSPPMVTWKLIELRNYKLYPITGDYVITVTPTSWGVNIAGTTDIGYYYTLDWDKTIYPTWWDWLNGSKLPYETASTLATVKGIDRIVALQSDTDFGWDWDVTTLTEHSANPSATNLYGVTALGLLDAYELTGDTSYFDAAKNVADFIMYGNASEGDFYYGWDSYYWGFSFDYRFLVRFAEISGNTTYRDYAIDAWNWVTENRGEYYGDGNQTAMYNFLYAHYGTHGGAIWQASDFALAALACGDTAWAGDMVSVIQSNLTKIDGTDGYRYIGWGKALEMFQAVNPTAYAAEISAVIGNLTDTQNEEGFWDTTPSADAAQNTAYAIIGLMAVGEADTAAKGALWLISTQLENAGWGTPTEISEVDSEAVQALCASIEAGVGLFAYYPHHWDWMDWWVTEGSLTDITYDEIMGWTNPDMYADSGNVSYKTFMGNTEMADPDLTYIHNDPDIAAVIPWIRNTAAPPYTWFFSAVEPDGVYGPHIAVGGMLATDTGKWYIFPEGEGALATIRFRAIKQAYEDLTCNLTLFDITMLDKDGTDIPYEDPVSGTYTMLAFELPGRQIDLYTQYPAPYGGQGPNEPSDMFTPQQEVILYAYVAYNWWPMQNKYVSYEIIDPQNVTWAKRTAFTNEEGIAEVRFRMPWLCEDPESLFGVWDVIATVDVAEEVINDTLQFHYDYLVNIAKVTTDALEYAHLDTVTITIELGSHAMQFHMNVIVTVAIYDELGFTVGFASAAINVTGAKFCSPKAYEVELTIEIPKYAVAGLATLHVCCFDKEPAEGGVALCPEYEPVPEIFILPY